eukprot:COSAG01_NODE_8188_length_2885_cov_14.256281_3_plen_90_part_00
MGQATCSRWISLSPATFRKRGGVRSRHVRRRCLELMGAIILIALFIHTLYTPRNAIETSYSTSTSMYRYIKTTMASVLEVLVLEYYRYR